MKSFKCSHRKLLNLTKTINKCRHEKFENLVKKIYHEILIFKYGALFHTNETVGRSVSPIRSKSILNLDEL